MKTLKVKYTGHKAKISVVLPIGAKTKGEISEIKEMKQGEEYELPEVDAIKLNKSDDRFELTNPPKKLKNLKLSEMTEEAVEEAEA